MWKTALFIKAHNLNFYTSDVSFFFLTKSDIFSQKVIHVLENVRSCTLVTLIWIMIKIQTDTKHNYDGIRYCTFSFLVTFSGFSSTNPDRVYALEDAGTQYTWYIIYTGHGPSTTTTSV